MRFTSTTSDDDTIPPKHNNKTISNNILYSLSLSLSQMNVTKKITKCTYYSFFSTLSLVLHNHHHHHRRR
ncbi:hypothetical protein OAV88_02500 [bacterium]|nr:hypothetical protein [bacterium]